MTEWREWTNVAVNEQRLYTLLPSYNLDFPCKKRYFNTYFYSDCTIRYSMKYIEQRRIIVTIIFLSLHTNCVLKYGTILGPFSLCVQQWNSQYKRNMIKYSNKIEIPINQVIRENVILMITWVCVRLHFLI